MRCLESRQPRGCLGATIVPGTIPEILLDTDCSLVCSRDVNQSSNSPVGYNAGEKGEAKWGFNFPSFERSSLIYILRGIST